MITLGIDPGFARCGYAFIESKNSIYRIVESGLIETFKETEYNQRLKKIYDDLNNLIKKETGYNLFLNAVDYMKTKNKIKVKSKETFYITGKEGHYLENVSSAEAKILWVSTPPVF